LLQGYGLLTVKFALRKIHLEISMVRNTMIIVTRYDVTSNKLVSRFAAYNLGAGNITGTIWEQGFDIEGVVMLMEIYVFIVC